MFFFIVNLLAINMHRIALLNADFLAKSLAPKTFVTTVYRSIQEMTSDLIKRGIKFSKNDILSKWLEEGSQNAFIVNSQILERFNIWSQI